MRILTRHSAAHLTALCLAALAALLSASGCASPPPATTDVLPNEAFQTSTKRLRFTSEDALAKFEAEEDPVYRLGPGDKIVVGVWDRPELSGEHRVGPDGRITLPVTGTLKVAEMTRDEAAAKIKKKLASAYVNLAVTVRVDEYVSNRILVLGRVENPGIIEFQTRPTLLEALSRAGCLPLLRKEQLLTRCAIIRGRSKVAWIDVSQLLIGGNLSLNLRLMPNDLIYIPDSSDTSVYVLGQVKNPGVYRYTPEMTFMDALGQAGGLTEDAVQFQVYLIRPSEKMNVAVDIREFLKPRPNVNVQLREGDILYVPKSGIAKVGYVLQQLSPLNWFMLITAFR